MLEFVKRDVFDMPTTSLSYSKSVFVDSGLLKWLPAALIAVFSDLGTVFGELFWVVVGLWLCDFLLGITKAWAAQEELSWTKAFNSILKLFVICIAVFATHLVEHLVGESGISIDHKISTAALLVIGTTEAISIFDNLTYFWPALEKLSQRVRDLLNKGRNGQNEG